MRDIAGHEGRYAVTKEGRVWSYPKKGTGGHGGMWMKQALLLGYPSVTLLKDGIGKRVKVSRLVAGAFIPNPHGLPIVNHINGIKTDSRVENLEWVTDSENKRHAWRIGLFGDKSKAACAANIMAVQEQVRRAHLKLTDAQVAEARRLFRDGIRRARLAKKYGVSKGTINRAVIGDSYRHVAP